MILAAVGRGCRMLDGGSRPCSASTRSRRASSTRSPTTSTTSPARAPPASATSTSSRSRWPRPGAPSTTACRSRSRPRTPTPTRSSTATGSSVRAWRSTSTPSGSSGLTPCRRRPSCTRRAATRQRRRPCAPARALPARRALSSPSLPTSASLSWRGPGRRRGTREAHGRRDPRETLLAPSARAGQAATPLVIAVVADRLVRAREVVGDVCRVPADAANHGRGQGVLEQSAQEVQAGLGRRRRRGVASARRSGRRPEGRSSWCPAGIRCTTRRWPRRACARPRAAAVRRGRRQSEVRAPRRQRRGHGT